MLRAKLGTGAGPWGTLAAGAARAALRGRRGPGRPRGTPCPPRAWAAARCARAWRWASWKELRSRDGAPSRAGPPAPSRALAGDASAVPRVELRRASGGGGAGARRGLAGAALGCRPARPARHEMGTTLRMPVLAAVSVLTGRTGPAGRTGPSGSALRCGRPRPERRRQRRSLSGGAPPEGRRLLPLWPACPWAGPPCSSPGSLFPETEPGGGGSSGRLRSRGCRWAWRRPDCCSISQGPGDAAFPRPAWPGSPSKGLELAPSEQSRVSEQSLVSEMQNRGPGSWLPGRCSPSESGACAWAHKAASPSWGRGWSHCAPHHGRRRAAFGAPRDCGLHPPTDTSSIGLQSFPVSWAGSSGPLGAWRSNWASLVTSLLPNP